ncbi:calcium-activated chloride channel regulator 1-like isoform X1 [Tachypleus tridentatus]|uniref:calcium-activated chloride channel regulator 1-like isoform X1 n=1 Tax=Tachypleus tridentatus TaxID=6853 RepID=UPI003FCF7040
MSCTVKDSIKVLSSTGKPAAGGNIVMVTTGEMDNEGVDTMRELLKKEKVRLSLILYPVSKNANPNLVELAHDTKGRTFQINEKSSDEFSILTSLFELHQAFQDVIRGNSWEASDIPVTIASQCWAGSVQNMKFEFTVDKTVRKDLKVLLYGKDLSDPSKTPIILSSLKLIDPSETEIDSEELDNNMYFTVLGFIVEKAEAGLWKFSVDVKETSSYPFLLWVSAKETSETRAISVNVWLSTKDKKDVGGLPVVYVDVRSGVYPVSNAKVEAKVFNSRGDKESFQLFDSGLGDPDITRGDGIYSRYLTAISHKGWYSIIVYVDDNNGGAKLLKGLNSDQPCCGSFVPEDNAESAESFSRISHYGRLYILHDELDVSNPPSRITDLRVINLEELSKTVTLKWTAPGGDYDSGKGSYYLVKYFDNIYDARNQFEITGYDAKPNDILLTPEEYGTSQEANFLIDDSAWKDKEIYFGIVCVDDKDSKGEISNIVAVFLRSFLETTTVTEVTTTPNITTTYPNDKKKDDSNPNVPLILGLVFGFTGFGLFVLLIAFLYFRRRKWKAEHDKDYKNNQRRAEKDNNKNVHSNQKKDKDEIFQLPTSANYPEDSNHIQREINTNLNDVSVHPTIVQDVTPSAPSKNLSMWKHSSIYETATDSDSDVLTHRGKKGLNGRPDFQSSSSPLNSSLQSINEVCLPPKFPPSIVI